MGVAGGVDRSDERVLTPLARVCDLLWSLSISVLEITLPSDRV